MCENQKGSKENTTTVFAALMRIAKPGQTISFRSGASADAPERSGVLLELNSDGIVIDTASEIEWISSQSIQSWRLLKQAGWADSST